MLTFLFNCYVLYLSLPILSFKKAQIAVFLFWCTLLYLYKFGEFFNSLTILKFIDILNHIICASYFPRYKCNNAYIHNTTDFNTLDTILLFLFVQHKNKMKNITKDTVAATSIVDREVYSIGVALQLKMCIYSN